MSDSSPARRWSQAAVNLVLWATALALVAFSAWCYLLLSSLQGNREAIERRSQWLSAREAVEQDASSPAGALASDIVQLQQATQALRQEGSAPPLIDAALKALQEELGRASQSTSLEPLTDPLRQVSAHVQREISVLGARMVELWNSLSLVLLAAMALAASNLVLLLLTQRDARRLRALSIDLAEQLARRARAEAAQEALERSRRELRQIIETLNDGVAILRGGEVLFANPALSRALSGESPALLLKEQPGERSISRAGGAAILSISPSQEIDFEGKSASLVVVRDVTQERQMQSRLRLTDRLASVGTLAAGVAHEINNPLAYVSANLSFLGHELRQAGSEPRLLDALKDAREGVRRVEQIVRDIKTFSRADEQARPTDLAGVLRSALNISRREITPKATIAEEYAPGLPFVLASEARLGQVFLNLLVNAAHAIPAGRPEQNFIRVRARREGERIEVSIQDTGGGIPKENLARIFDPFFTTKPVGEGTGLGLSICHSIITGLGGDLRVESELGVGTTFRVLLPTTDEQPSNLPKPSPSEELQRAPRKAKLLLVDDEPAILTALRRLLSKHDLTTCGDSREALARLLGGDEYDLVLCDLMMPGLTGIDLYEEVSRVRPDYEPRFLFMTGGVFEGRAQALCDRIPERCIGKPLDLERLLSLIRERIGA